MNRAGDVLRSWLVEHGPGDVSVAQAVARGHRRFVTWLVLRTIIGVLLGSLLIAGVVAAHSWVRGDSDHQGSAPIARLAVHPEAGSVPLKVTADGAGSTGSAGATIVTFSFVFAENGKKTTGSKPEARHTYQKAGSYTVTLTVTDSAGRSSQATVAITVTPKPSRPKARLVVTPTSGVAPLTVTANGSKSTGSSGAAIASYRFDFGDGAVVGPQQEKVATHRYLRASRYTVELTVVDSNHRTRSTSTKVSIRERAAKPRAVLVLTPPSQQKGQMVSADGSGSVAAQGSRISSYTFDFGDGTIVGPQQEATAAHTYRKGTVYTVTLTVKDSHDQTGTDQQKVDTAVPGPR